MVFARNIIIINWGGRLRGEGVLFFRRENLEIEFYWNLRLSSNNTAKAYVVFQWIQITKNHQIPQLNIVGDSKNTIRYFVTG
jgi:hypothetical protein